MANLIRISGPIYGGTAPNALPDSCCYAGNAAARIRAAAGDIELMINSPGGELEGLGDIVAALHDWRTANPDAQCVATVTALAASAAAYLLLMLPRGARVRAYPLAMLMYHSSASIACGGSGAMRDAAHYLEQLDTVLRSYLERTAVPGNLIDEWLSEGRQGWLNAQEAQAYGIVDEIVEGDAELPAMPADNGLRAVAVFYPNHQTNKELREMAESIQKAKAEEKEIEKTEVVTDDDGQKQVVETETETETVEEPVADCNKPAAEGTDLSEVVAALTARVEELEKALEAAQAAQAKASASLAALSGGLRGAAAPQAKAPEPKSWNEALAAYRREHPDMAADDAFCACARLHRDLWRATITPVR
jgi:ATP-dependent protease ClpP protease subunit